jgi:NAD(P)-dependent dehydrogenase (short-subunit alcohol dehydrogenase family)
MHVNLDGRTAIVTGAGRGIGRRIAIEFADSGANVVAAARTRSEIERTAAAAEDRGVEALAVPTDLRDVDDIDRLVDAAVDAFGPPAVLVNDAAAHVAGDPLERRLGEVDTMLEVNLRGLHVLSQRVASELVTAEREWGRIVNLSSVAGDVGVRGMAVYSATKAGVKGLTRGMAVEFATHGITVNCVSPGLTRVERIERLMAEKGELYHVDGIPLGRLGEPEDVAAACLFLVSDRAGYITGVDLPVDGGAKVTSAMYPYD